ncbi:denD [Symbiodinium sp. CCMP2592]|nr:denD [Symbiodinium sp. CCMP2592]
MPHSPATFDSVNVKCLIELKSKNCKQCRSDPPLPCAREVHTHTHTHTHPPLPAHAHSDQTAVVASYVRTYGEQGRAIGDTDKIVPKNTYGMTKAVCELLVNDYTRKGFIDGRTARLPTVIVRPGRPNAATTSCFSGVVREPLHGEDAVLPVARMLPHSVTSTRALISNLVILHDADWPKTLTDRSANLPSRPCTLQQLIDALYEVVPEDEHTKLGKIVDKEDAFLSRVVGSMGSNLSYERARELRMLAVPDLKTAPWIVKPCQVFGCRSGYIHCWLLPCSSAAGEHAGSLYLAKPGD